MYRLLLTITVGVSLLTASSSARSAYWEVESIYSGGLGSGDTSLATDNTNAPTVSYSANGSLYLASRVSNVWTSQFIASVGFWGGCSSLAFDPSNQPCVAYIDATGTTNYLKYAYKSTGWHLETIEAVGWMPDYVALCFNPSGQACIAYCKTTGTFPATQVYVCFARRTGTNTWSKENIIQAGDVTGPSMCVDSLGTYRVCFADPVSGQLKLATKSGSGSWQISIVDGSSSTPAVWYTSLTLQPNGQPAIGYFLSSSSSVHLTYASQSGSVWRKETVTAVSPGSADYCSLAVSADGLPMLAYYDTTQQSFGNAWKTGGSWFVEDVDSANQTGMRPSMKLDSAGNVNVSYFDDANANVKLAWALCPVPVKSAKTTQDGATCQFSGVVASSSTGNIPNRIYVQEPDRSYGIQLYFDKGVPVVARGATLEVQGQLTTQDDERAIYNPAVDPIGSMSVRPVGLSNLAMGGGNYQYLPGPPPTGQRGPVGGTGLNNVGLLITTWGKVTHVGTGYFYLDDGSSLNDGSGYVGIKVSVSGLPIPSEKSYVQVSGECGLHDSGGNPRRLLLVRDSSDIITLRRPM